MSSRTRAFAAASLTVVAIAVASACVQTQRALGEDCLKDQDCLSGICSQLQCAAAPPLLDGGVPQGPGAEAGPEAGVDAAVEGGPDAPPDVAAESAPPGDGAGNDSAADASSE
jgi:hypothetical protein